MEPHVVARLDFARQRRTGVPEVVYTQAKTFEQNVEAIRGLHERTGFALATRVPAAQRAAMRDVLPEAEIDDRSACIRWGRLPASRVRIAVICSETSDSAVADEVAFTLEAFGHDAVCMTDATVARIPQLLERLPMIASARVVVVVAGMESALPSVIAGLIRAPIIAVPTSSGFGASFDGMKATCRPRID